MSFIIGIILIFMYSCETVSNNKDPESKIMSIKLTASDDSASCPMYWVTDGCSVPHPTVEELFKKIGINPSPECYKHDLCYRTFGKPQDRCDLELHDNLNRVCKNKYCTKLPTGGLVCNNLGLDTCRGYADVWRLAVEKGGGKKYKMRQENRAVELVACYKKYFRARPTEQTAYKDEFKLALLKIFRPDNLNLTAEDKERFNWVNDSDESWHEKYAYIISEKKPPLAFSFPIQSVKSVACHDVPVKYFCDKTQMCVPFQRDYLANCNESNCASIKGSQYHYCEDERLCKSNATACLPMGAIEKCNRDPNMQWCYPLNQCISKLSQCTDQS